MAAPIAAAIAAPSAGAAARVRVGRAHVGAPVRGSLAALAIPAASQSAASWSYRANELRAACGRGAAAAPAVLPHGRAARRQGAAAPFLRGEGVTVQAKRKERNSQGGGSRGQLVPAPASPTPLEGSPSPPAAAAAGQPPTPSAAAAAAAAQAGPGPAAEAAAAAAGPSLLSAPVNDPYKPGLDGISEADPEWLKAGGRMMQSTGDALIEMTEGEAGEKYTNGVLAFFTVALPVWAVAAYIIVSDSHK